MPEIVEMFSGACIVVQRAGILRFDDEDTPNAVGGTAKPLYA